MVGFGGCSGSREAIMQGLTYDTYEEGWQGRRQSKMFGRQNETKLIPFPALVASENFPLGGEGKILQNRITVGHVLLLNLETFPYNGIGCMVNLN